MIKPKNLLLVFTLVALWSCSSDDETTQEPGETSKEKTISLQPGYSDAVYYKFSNNTAQSFTASDWDIAFLRTGPMSIGTRINDGAGIEVFEATNDISDWANIDPANIGNWTQLFNSDTSWTVGAFDNGSATYGWGEYNGSNHHVTGSVVFVLKYPDDSFKKFMIEDFFGGYTFKYADWNAASSTWEADETYVLPNSNNPDNQFNYFSLKTDSEVLAAPATGDWDLVFKKYSTDVGGGMMYPVTGVLHNSEVSVAENTEPDGNADTSNLQYSEDINTVGHDWKEFNMETGSYTVDPNKYFYLKAANGTVYRFHFTAFEGSSTGDLTLEYEQIN